MNVMSKNNYLFLYMVPETGHQKAADAVIKAMSYMDPRVVCTGLDAGSQAFPILGDVLNRVYLRMLKTAPGIWDYLYDNPDVEQLTREARDFLTLISSFRVRGMMKRYQPSAIICTQAVPAVAFAAEKRKGNYKGPLIGIVTDFGVHTYWVHQEVDLYLVAHDDTKKELVARGVRENKIRVTGIPVMPQFGKTLDPVEERKKLKWSPGKKTVLVMGGSRGLGSMADVVEALRSIPYDFQVAVVCGRNRAAMKKMNQFRDNSNWIQVYGYVKDMSSLMAASDILVTKPGGLTCSEAIAKQLPMVVSNPLPGQEEKNVAFLTRHRLAVFAPTLEDMVHSVSDLLQHPKKTQQLRQRLRGVAKPHSAWEAARTIIDLVKLR
jgi:processive 1,2-diacylglycerol beta-glucosyltransferase